jgi:hypothetical protein
MFNSVTVTSKKKKKDPANELPREKGVAVYMNAPKIMITIK